MAGVLIDVMNGRIDGTKVGHRLTAARLLIIYGYDDADDFIADNAPITSETDPDDKVWGIDRPRPHQAHQVQDRRWSCNLPVSHRDHAG